MSDLLSQRIREAVAANLREFGYPDCTADNVLTTKLFAMFAKSQIEDFGEKHAGNAEVQEAIGPLLDTIAKTTGEPR